MSAVWKFKGMVEPPCRECDVASYMRALQSRQTQTAPRTRPGDPQPSEPQRTPETFLDRLPKSNGYFAFVYRRKILFARMATVHRAKSSLENVSVTLQAVAQRFPFDRPYWGPRTLRDPGARYVSWGALLLLASTPPLSCHTTSSLLVQPVRELLGLRQLW